MLENDLFEMLPEFSNVVHILAVIQNINDHSVQLCRLQTYLHVTVSNIALINIELKDMCQL